MFDEMPVMDSRGPVYSLFMFYKCIIVMLCKFISESAIDLWAVTWARKSGSNPGEADTSLSIWQKSPSTHACPYQGSVWEFNGLKIQWNPDTSYLRGWDGSLKSCF